MKSGTLFSGLSILAIMGFLAISCSKDPDIPPDNGWVKIISLTASDTVLKAWMDTAVVAVVATGNNLTYEWNCDHGTIHGSGDTIRYMAGQCCVGLNTVSCRVSNDSSSVSKNVRIRITSYFEK